MLAWLAALFQPKPDENERKIRRLFSFLLNEHGFCFDKIDLGNAVSKDGEFLFYGPLIAYRIYNKNTCINILYLTQRQDYEIFITDLSKDDQIYIRNGRKVSNDIELFAEEAKKNIINGSWILR